MVIHLRPHSLLSLLPVFVKTLEELPTQHPFVYEAFMKGYCTSRKSNSAFSVISDDHLHEQNNKNKMIKSDGGAVGFLQTKLHY